MRKAILAGALFIIGAAINVSAEAPNLFTYQGRLKEGGQAVSANRTVEIKLCPVETGGVCETTGAQPVAVSNGLFRSTFTIPAAVNFGTGSWWLEIWVGADQLTPRERLTSNAYSLFSATATYAENISAASGSEGVYVSSNLIVTGSYASAPQLQLAAGVAVSSEASAALGGGLNVSSNVYIVGFSSAARYYGDGSALSGLPGADSLGSHIATQTLQMGGYGVFSSSYIGAAAFQINGSTVLALSASRSMGLGLGAGRVNTGQTSLFVGEDAGYDSTGHRATFVGVDAGRFNIGGSNNSYFGMGAGYLGTTGSDNTVAGAYALWYNVTGAQNVAMGVEAGMGTGLNQSSFSSSTLVGYRTGAALQNGSYGNVLLGYLAGDSLNTGSRNILIGYDADAPSAASNDQLNIGGVLYGDLSARTVGISTRAPQAALDVVSTGTASNVYAQIWRDGTGVARASVTSEGRFSGDGSGLTNLPAAGGAVQKTGDTMTGDLFMSGGSSISVTGAIGISTAAPGAQLAIEYAWGTTTPIMTVWEPTAGYTFGLDKNAHLYYGPYLNYGSGSIVNFGGNQTQVGSGAVMFHLYPQSVAPGGYLLKAQEGADTRLVIDSEGRVGAGTTSPASRFEVAGGSITISGAEAGLLFDGAERKIAPTANASVGGGLYVSTNVYTLGFSSATKYYGDGSALTGVSGVDAAKLPLAGGTMSGNINMGGNHLYSVSTVTASGDITAASYQINGSTVLSVLNGTGNLGIGVNAGWQNTAGYNVIAGYGAGAGDTAGGANVIIGYSAGSNNSGDYSTLIGYMAGFSNAGNYNSFIGYSAGLDNTTGNNNLALGNEAAYYNKVGAANTMLGIGAGRGVDTFSFSSATLAGYHAGYALSTGNDNILIGFQAGDNLNTGGRNIIIGYDLDATAPTISNEIRIGNIIFGNMTTGGVAVGANNTLPLAALDVKSTGTASNIYAQVWRDGGGAVVSSMTSTGLLVVSSITTTGRVGIGTNAPDSTLEVRGNAKIARYHVEAADTGKALTGYDFGKTFTVNSVAAQTITLPAVTASDVGAQITVVKLGTGKLSVTATGAYISDSTLGGGIYNNAVTPPYASLTLRLVTSTQWMLVGGEGSWITN